MRRGARALAPAVLGALVAGPAGAAAERFDHQGSVNAVAATGLGFAASSSSAVVPGVGLRWAELVGGGLAVDHEGHELFLLLRLTGRGGALDAAGLVGLRASFGDERWRTFFDLQLAVPFFPVPLIGPRFGAGVQYELTPVAGVFCAGAVQLGTGAALLFTADLACGVQLRSYVLP